MMRLGRALAILAVAVVCLAPAYGCSEDMARLAESCAREAERAADRHGVPPDLLRAIAEVESGRSLAGGVVAWPWTLNVAGEGVWFRDRESALAHAARAIASGERSVDLGCFQINYRWHGEAFGSLDAMLDPGYGADYAARFLRRLFAETGDWFRAVGHYHSRTPGYATRYLARVRSALSRLSARGLAVPAAPRSDRSASEDLPAVAPLAGGLLRAARGPLAESRTAGLFAGPSRGGLLRRAARPLIAAN